MADTSPLNEAELGAVRLLVAAGESLGKPLQQACLATIDALTAERDEYLRLLCADAKPVEEITAKMDAFLALRSQLEDVTACHESDAVMLEAALASVAKITERYERTYTSLGQCIMHSRAAEAANERLRAVVDALHDGDSNPCPMCHAGIRNLIEAMPGSGYGTPSEGEK